MILELHNVGKTYVTEHGVTHRALSDVKVSFESTGMVFLVGKSGSGKSTLLNIIGGLDKMDTGDMIIGKNSILSMSNSSIDYYRNTMIGFVFQSFNLIDSLSARENISLALDMQAKSDNKKVDELMERFGIADKASTKAKFLSGGQRQRVAIVRALVKDPQIILADEPTGALDIATGNEIMQVLKEMSKTRLVIVVTHDLAMASHYGDRIVELKDGHVYRDVRRRHENEEIVFPTVEVFGGSLVRVRKGEKLNQTDLEKLNEIISLRGRKTFLNVDSDPLRVKAMFPNLREAVDFSVESEKQTHGSENALTNNTANSETTNGDEDVVKTQFVTYKPPIKQAKTVELIPSRMPSKKAIMFALHNLSLKKVRLALTIFVSFVTIVFLSITQSFILFDIKLASANTIARGERERIMIKTADGFDMRAGEVQRFRNDFPSMSFFSEYELPEFLFKKVSFESNDIGDLSFSYLMETLDITESGFSILCGSSKIANEKSVVISKYSASIILQSIPKSNKIDYIDLIGRVIEIDGVSVNITGIFESVDADELAEKRSNPFFQFNSWEAQEEERTVNTIHVRDTFVKSYVAGIRQFKVRNATLALDSNFNTRGYTDFDIAVDCAETYDKNDFAVDHRGSVNGSDTLESENDIFLSDSFFNGHVYSLERVNESTGTCSLSIGEKTVVALENFVIRGIIDNSATSNIQIVIFHPAVVEKIISNAFRCQRISAHFNGSFSNASSFSNHLFEIGLLPDTEFLNLFSITKEILVSLSDTLTTFGALLALLVVFMLFTFISSSIRQTKKQIGILRALGAKKTDTFKIYALEGFIIAFSSLILAFSSLVIFVPIINALASAGGLFIAFINIPLIVIGTMSLLIIGVALTSIIIPWFRFSRITPIEAISERQD